MESMDLFCNVNIFRMLKVAGDKTYSYFRSAEKKKEMQSAMIVTYFWRVCTFCIEAPRCTKSLSPLRNYLPSVQEFAALFVQHDDALNC